ncbi:MAG: aminopeptidase N [Geobacter sp.]|nr:MAG: aminopeptidase N [Geobacter sp.]
MSESLHRVIHQKDYTPPDYLVDNVEICFELGEEITSVTSRLALRTNFAAGAGQPLVLYGHRFMLRGIKLDNSELTQESYKINDDLLTIHHVPRNFVLEIRTELRPQENSFLEGLYCSAGMFCTQCEAEGFRSITYYPDRPDVLAVFTTTIIADQARCPVLLSNGNLLEQGRMPGGRHYARWHDPFPKPSYLFAMVAGDLACIEDSFTTCSQRQVALRIYVQADNRNKCAHAMLSLKRAMRWDEETFGREYDLDCYMIVAVDDFNMGAMENKGLNVFNSRYVLASPETATDDDYQAIEEVIGHEYFHNWSGNRVTCRDWFQLSLKEGLTIFRDQEFSADMESRGVKRINDVRYLRTHQFPEDAGPMAHPVRPDSYMEINNFYTLTVYNKGAEIIRMLHTLLGPERFRQGMDTYFARYDGQAATVDDFVQAMAEAGSIDLHQFSLWYSQAGTPLLKAEASFDAAEGVLALTLCQSCPATPSQPEKQPFHIPISMGLLGQDGRQLPVTLEGESQPGPVTRVIELKTSAETYRFAGLPEKPALALLRGLSAPVRLDFPYSHEELLVIMDHEPDPFCRWEAGQLMSSRIILDLVADWQGGRELVLDPAFVAAFRTLLSSWISDHAFLAEMLTLPSEKYLAEQMAVIDPEAVHGARRFVIRTLAATLGDEFLSLRAACRSGEPYAPADGRAGERRLANLCLAYLVSTGDQAGIDHCMAQYRQADNMTDSMGALNPLVSCDCPERLEAVADFYQRWQGDRQVVDKWFTLQAISTLPGALAEVKALVDHPDFELGNPNRFRALVGAFSQGNQVRFHEKGGEGYRFLVDQLIRLIPLNPQVSARLLAPLTQWRRYDQGRQELMRSELLRISSLPDLPRDVYEVVVKSLDG